MAGGRSEGGDVARTDLEENAHVAVEAPGRVLGVCTSRASLGTMVSRGESVIVAIGLYAAACGASSTPTSAPPTSRSSSQSDATSTAATPPVASAAAAAPCRPRSADQARILETLSVFAKQPDIGAMRDSHEQLFRHFPLLAEKGTVTSIVPTLASGANGATYAFTVLVRNASGEMDPFLGFAAAPCPNGDLATVAPLVPLHGHDAALQYARRIPLAAATLTELEVDESETTVGRSKVSDGKSRRRSVVVGAPVSALTVTAPPNGSFGVLGSIDELDTPFVDPSPGAVRGIDQHISGSGWYAHGDGADYLLVHHVVHDQVELCAKKVKVLPHSPPSLRLVARLDVKGGFTRDPVRLGVAYVVGVGDNNPTEAMMNDRSHSCLIGPMAIDDRYFTRGAPAQYLFGLFDSSAAASSKVRELGYKGGTVFSTEPPRGMAAAAEPWTIPVRRASSSSAGPACVDYF